MGCLAASVNAATFLSTQIDGKPKTTVHVPSCHFKWYMGKDGENEE